jgi:hypothetical protein
MEGQRKGHNRRDTNNKALIDRFDQLYVFKENADIEEAKKYARENPR